MERLLACWNSEELPPELTSMLLAFESSFQSERWGTLLNNIQAMRDPSLPFFKAQFSGASSMVVNAQVHAALLQGIVDINYSRVLLHNPFTFHGVKYKKHFSPDESQGVGNSLVVLGQDIQVAWMPACIEGVYEIPLKAASKSITKLVVHLYNELNEEDAAKDPYRIYAIAGSHLYYSTFWMQLQMIDPSDILCHFALMPNVVESLTCPHIHILPLDRVSLILTMCIN